MKKLIFGLIAATMLMACHQNTTTSTAATAAASIKFTEDKFDFGKIKQGDSVMHQFEFVNNGKAPLIITDAVASCGCTKPEWPKEPVQPGAKGVIKVTFHSQGKKGLQDKMITVTGNTSPAQSMVHLTGEVTESK